MPEAREKKTVKVSILGQNYSIKSVEEEKVRQVADFLNDQIEAIKQGSPVLNRIDLSVMTAFKLASDLVQAQEELDRLKMEIETKAANLTMLIENRLAGGLDI